MRWAPGGRGGVVAAGYAVPCRAGRLPPFTGRAGGSGCQRLTGSAHRPRHGGLRTPAAPRRWCPHTGVLVRQSLTAESGRPVTGRSELFSDARSPVRADALALLGPGRVLSCPAGRLAVRRWAAAAGPPSWPDSIAVTRRRS